MRRAYTRSMSTPSASPRHAPRLAVASGAVGAGAVWLVQWGRHLEELGGGRAAVIGGGAGLIAAACLLLGALLLHTRTRS